MFDTVRADVRVEFANVTSRHLHRSRCPRRQLRTAGSVPVSFRERPNSLALIGAEVTSTPARIASSSSARSHWMNARATPFDRSVVIHSETPPMGAMLVVDPYAAARGTPTSFASLKTPAGSLPESSRRRQISLILPKVVVAASSIGWCLQEGYGG